MKIKGIKRGQTIELLPTHRKINLNSFCDRHLEETEKVRVLRHQEGDHLTPLVVIRFIVRFHKLS